MFSRKVRQECKASFFESFARVSEAIRKKGEKQEWFQVTLGTTHSPTGMHGQNVASRSDVT
jgi:hypothetical protein